MAEAQRYLTPFGLRLSNVISGICRPGASKAVDTFEVRPRKESYLSSNSGETVVDNCPGGISDTGSDAAVSVIDNGYGDTRTMFAVAVASPELIAHMEAVTSAQMASVLIDDGTDLDSDKAVALSLLAAGFSSRVTALLMDRAVGLARGLKAAAHTVPLILILLT